MEEDIVTLSKPYLYKRHVDDIYVRRKNEWNLWILQRIEVQQNIKLNLELKINRILRYEG